MMLLVWLLALVLLLAVVNYVAYFFGIDIAGLAGPGDEPHGHEK